MNAVNVLVTYVIRVTSLHFSSLVTEQNGNTRRSYSGNIIVAEYWFMIFHAYVIKVNVLWKMANLSKLQQDLQSSSTQNF
jgi:hypothetical protein